MFQIWPSASGISRYMIAASLVEWEDAMLVAFIEWNSNNFILVYVYYAHIHAGPVDE